MDTQGDAFFFAFARASDAVSAAADVQAALVDGPVRVRMGIHTGEPIVTEEGYVGVDVHRAARIMSAGHGGQILLSDPTRQLLDATVGLRDLGEHRLKDLSAPRRLHQLGAGEFPPLKTLYQTNLPIQPTPLVGRQRERGEAGALIRSHRLVTLTGPGGSGKTRLALHIAAEVAEDFADGVFWVPLAAVSDADLVLPTVAETIAATDGVPDHVEAKRMLLLLDNFEQVIAAAPELGDLLQRCPNLKVLVTSRAPLRLSGEWEYQVEPLPEIDAIDLFVERARAILSKFEPDESVTEICRRLDRLPLAIELAAARCRGARGARRGESQRSSPCPIRKDRPRAVGRRIRGRPGGGPRDDPRRGGRTRTRRQRIRIVQVVLAITAKKPTQRNRGLVGAIDAMSKLPIGGLAPVHKGASRHRRVALDARCRDVEEPRRPPFP